MCTLNLLTALFMFTDLLSISLLIILFDFYYSLNCIEKKNRTSKKQSLTYDDMTLDVISPFRCASVVHCYEIYLLNSHVDRKKKHHIS